MKNTRVKFRFGAMMGNTQTRGFSRSHMISMHGRMQRGVADTQK